MTAAAVSSPLEVAVLAMLETGPLHPYGLQQLIRRSGKDAVLNAAQRSNLYKAVKRLHAADLVEIRHTERGGAFPERTLYALTDAGRAAGKAALTALLATPQAELPAFAGALSLAMLLGPGQLLAALERRAAALRERLDSGPAEPASDLPRVALIEREYQLAMVRAELAWVDSVVGELRTGALAWSGGYDASTA
jgi:DNA-binding PadR family transcriptional regulator